MCIYKTILNYTPENGYDDKFYLAFTTIFYKRKQRKKENGCFSFQEMLVTSIAINSLMTKVIGIFTLIHLHKEVIHFFAFLLIPHFWKTLSKTCSCQWQRQNGCQQPLAKRMNLLSTQKAYWTQKSKCSFPYMNQGHLYNKIPPLTSQ